MSKKLLMFFFILITVFPLVSKDQTADREDFKIDHLIEILNYGIEDEVVSILKDLGPNPKEVFYPILTDRYEEAQLPETKIEIIKYFSNCENLPGKVLDFLYHEAEKDQDNIKLLTNLYTFLGKKGGYREGLLLINKLDDDNQMIAQGAAEALAIIKDKKLVSPVLNRLELSDQSDDRYLSDLIKGKLILSLGEMKAPEASDYLKKVVDEPLNDKFLIMYSMVSLAKIDDESAVPIIYKKLSSDEVKIQEYAAYSLSLYKSKQVLPYLKNMLKHNNEKIRVFACQGALLNRAPDLLNILYYKYKNDPAVAVRKEALSSLVKWGETGILKLKEKKDTDSLTDSDLLTISQATAKEPNDSSVLLLCDLYDTADEKKRELIVKGLITGNNPILDPVLKRMLKDRSYLIRLGAIRIIYQIQNSSLWNDVLSISQNDESEVVKNNAKKILELH